MENQGKPATKRLLSLDALRGFDMFWIMGGEGISFPFSYAKRTALNHSRASIYKHVIYRGLIHRRIFTIKISDQPTFAKSIVYGAGGNCLYDHR